VDFKSIVDFTLKAALTLVLECYFHTNFEKNGTK
jgi:hypothetical protein